MDIQEKLVALQESQQHVLHSLSTVIEEIRSADVVQENEKLQQALHDYRDRLDQLKQKHQAVLQENEKLSMALKEQILDEKRNILKISRQKLDTYFSTKDTGHENALLSWEKQAKQEIDNLYRLTNHHLDASKELFAAKLQTLSTEIYQQMELQRETYAQAKQHLAGEVSRRLEDFAQAEISEDVMAQRMKQNEIELTVGLNWVNKIGILLILFGVGAAAKYTYSLWFNAHMKGISFFLLGGLLLGSGEWFYRKAKEVFASGLIGGGISVLYGAIFYSYFLLHVINLYAGLGLSLMVTAAAVLLSIRYRSQTICALGLIGGYLPFFTYLQAYGLNGPDFYIAMGYLFNLNLVVLLVSFRNRWNVIHIVSFLMYIPSLVYLVFAVPNKIIGIIYVILGFSMYVTTILAYPLRYKMSLRRQDVAILGCNTFVSCFVLYGLFREAGWQGYNGLLAMGFCLLYMGLAKLARTYIADEKITILLFNATALTFAVLMVPFQLGIQWLSMGWLVEGIILILYGCRNRVIQLERAGWAVFGLCLAVFYLHDYLPALFHGEFLRVPYYFIKYTTIVAGLMFVAVYYVLDMKKHGIARYGVWVEKIIFFKVFALINLWLYCLYAGGKGIHYWLYGSMHYGFYDLITRALITLGFGYAIARMPLIADRYVHYLSGTLFAFGTLLCLYINTSIPVLPAVPSTGNAEHYFAFAVLCFYNILVLAAVREFILVVIREKDLSLELYPLYLSIYLLGTITAILTVQFRLGATHLAFSGIYLLMAVGALVYGFRKRFQYIRRFGLGLALFATTKLFLFDLTFLTALNKIFAYFCFGLVLLGISYMYQKLQSGEEARKLEGKV